MAGKRVTIELMMQLIQVCNCLVTMAPSVSSVYYFLLFFFPLDKIGSIVQHSKDVFTRLGKYIHQ